MGDRTHRDSQFELPQRLREDLASLYGAGPDLPADMDERILSASRRAMVGRRRSRMVLKWSRWVAGEAVAAAAVIALIIVLWGRDGGESGAPTAASAPESSESPSPDRGAASNGLARRDASPELRDIDGNGRVDILDAYTLALRVERGGDVRADWDFDGDGIVDRSDADVVAMQAVRLDGEAVQ